MTAEDLIERLVSEGRPVRPLPSPSRRLFLWLAVAVPAVALVVFAMSPRADLLDKFRDARFLIEQGAAVATAILAAYAALSTSIPGRPRAVAILPLLPLAVWLGSLGEGCVSTWLALGADGLSLSPDWVCFPGIAMTGAVPGVAMVAMIRRGVPLAPVWTVALAALAAAALGNAGLRLFHPQDASLMVLVWQFGTVAALSLLGGAMAPRLFPWNKGSIGDGSPA